MDKAHLVTPEIVIIPAHFSLPGVGFLPINAFLIKGREPMLVDTGMGIDGEEFVSTLEALIDPADLKWVWLTHDDADHTGNLQKIMALAPNARMVANSLAALRMSTAWPVPMERLYWLNPGESLDAGDRKLTAVRPPLYDNPSTIGIYDQKAEVFFSSDCFGALIPAPVETADAIEEQDLARGMTSWASGDSPWSHLVAQPEFSRVLDQIRRMDPKMILSSHLPPAQGKDKVALFLDWLANVPASTPFIAPNQAALEQLLAPGEN
jgi:flavorubredoxin